MKNGVKKLERAMSEHFGDMDSRGIVQLWEEDGKLTATVYHDRVTGKPIHGLLEAIEASTNDDELRKAIGKHASNMPKGGMFS